MEVALPLDEGQASSGPIRPCCALEVASPADEGQASSGGTCVGDTAFFEVL